MGHRLKTPVFLLILGASLTCHGQLQFPGRPMRVPTDLQAADVMYVLPPVDPLEVEALRESNRASLKKPLRFALSRPVSLAPSTHGSWQTVSGYRIWTVHIVSPGALSAGLFFDEFCLEKGVRVFVYDPQGKHVKGAFTEGNNKSSGVLPVGHLPGEELVVEMQVPDHMAGYGELSVGSVSHAFLPVAWPGSVKDDRFGRSQECEIDILCEEGEEWLLQKQSVVRIFTSTQYCTGVILNNTSYDGTPYVLTSEHCINRPFYADQSVFVFGYESPACFGGDGSVEMSIAGCDTLAVGDSIDFSLVRLSDVPPDSFDVYYAGWDLSGEQGPGNTAIHHPEGDVKKISYDADEAATLEKVSDIPQGDLRDYFYFSYWWIRQWDFGTTEGGSSGSPLFNSGKRVIGILTGGFARCGDSVGFDEDSQRILYNQAFNKDDYYTRLGVAWDYYGESGPALKPWLDPHDTGLTTISGFLPTGLERPVRPDKRFAVYPIPTSGNLRVEPLLPIRSPAVYRFFDLSGSLLLAGTIGPDGAALSLPLETAPGLYLLRIETADFPETHKVIVAR